MLEITLQNYSLSHRLYSSNLLSTIFDEHSHIFLQGNISSRNGYRYIVDIDIDINCLLMSFSYKKYIQNVYLPGVMKTGLANIL